MWRDGLGWVETKNKVAGAMLLWMLLFCENGKVNSKTEKNKKIIRNDLPMKGGEEGAGW